MVGAVFITAIVITVFVYSYFSALCGLALRRGLTHKREEILPTVTLIVCAYNEEAVILKKIENILQIDYPQERMNVWFVNDHSTDRTREIIAENIHQIPFAKKAFDNEFARGKTNALNYVFPKLESEVAIETDADSFLDPKSVRELVKNFADDNIGGANGVVKILSLEKGGQAAQHEGFYRTLYDFWRRGESAIDSISICNGPIMAFRTELVRDVQLRSMADDTELLFEIIRKNRRVVYDQNAIAYECTPANFNERIRQKMRRVKGVFQVYFRNLDLIGVGRFGRHIFPFVFLQICVIPYLVILGLSSFLILASLNPLLWLTFILMVIPKINTLLWNIISTQLIMALSPLHYKGGAWRTIRSSRQMLSDIDIETFKE
ncbi:MAG: glycosyltransferase [Desulfobacterales bacterium]|nr:MAG: glycosyltransferase [Desulfobacterales bacterium]